MNINPPCRLQPSIPEVDRDPGTAQGHQSGNFSYPAFRPNPVTEQCSNSLSNEDTGYYDYIHILVSVILVFVHQSLGSSHDHVYPKLGICKRGGIISQLTFPLHNLCSHSKVRKLRRSSACTSRDEFVHARSTSQLKPQVIPAPGKHRALIY